MKKWIVLGVAALIVGAAVFFVMKSNSGAVDSPAPVVQAEGEGLAIAPKADEAAPQAGSEGSATAAAPSEGTAWAKRCDKPKEEGKPEYCEVFQKLTVTKTKQRFLEFAVGYPAGKEKSPYAVIVLPLGILVQSGGTMQVDDKPVKQFGIQTCLPAGCIVKVELDAASTADMSAGNLLHLKFASAEGKVMGVDLQLKGFGSVFAGL